MTLYNDPDDSLLGTNPNGVNNQYLDEPQFTPRPLELNRNPRDGRPAFNTALFGRPALGTLGNAHRRFFYGPGINNWDMALLKTIHITEPTCSSCDSRRSTPSITGNSSGRRR